MNLFSYACDKQWRRGLHLSKFRGEMSAYTLGRRTHFFFCLRLHIYWFYTTFLALENRVAACCNVRTVFSWRIISLQPSYTILEWRRCKCAGGGVGGGSTRAPSCTTPFSSSFRQPRFYSKYYEFWSLSNTLFSKLMHTNYKIIRLLK